MPQYIAISGLKEAQAKLRELGAKTGKKIIRAALKIGGQPLLKYEQMIAPIGDRTDKHRGQFRKSIVLRVATSRKRNTMAVAVRFNPKAFKGEDYSRFEEVGHQTGNRVSIGLAALIVKARANRGEDFGAAVRSIYRKEKQMAGATSVPGAHTLDKTFSAARTQAISEFRRALIDGLRAARK